MDKYHYTTPDSSTTEGPFSLEEMKSLKLPNSVKVWKEGTKGWVNINSIKELRTVVNQENQYYYSKNNVEVGPISLEELKSHPITLDSLVWKVGTPNWVKVHEVKELGELIDKLKLEKQNILRTTPPPLPTDREGKLMERFDLSHPKETGILIFGIVTLLMYLMFYTYFRNSGAFNYDQVIFIDGFLFVVRIVEWWIVLEGAKRLNRQNTGWGIAGILAPSITMIVLGTKHRYKQPKQ